MSQGSKGVIEVDRVIVGDGTLDIECSEEAFAEMVGQLEEQHMRALEASGVVKVTTVSTPFSGVPFFRPQDDEGDG